MDSEALKQQELLEKKKRRLERNRASARQCRKRKKEKKLMLRQQLAHLEADNLQLRLKLQVGHETQNHVDQSAIITSKLNEMITEGASEAEIQKKIQELKERFSDYGRDRRSAIDFHIAQLRRCLQPTQTTRSILFLMSLAPRFPDITYGIATPNPNDDLMVLWNDLLLELKPDQSQRELMVNFANKKENERDPFQDIHDNTQNCNRILDRIVEIICNKNDSLDSEMANIQNILSPRQIAKFILWIDRNPACMQMLEALWPHITVSSSESPGNGGETIRDIEPSSGGSLIAELYDESDDDSSESD